MKLLLIFLFFLSPAFAQDVSPKDPWGDLEKVEIREQTGFTKALLWLPNRIVDLTDIVKFDVGLGTSFGAVLRLSKEGQMGYRKVSDMSLRVGHFGRESPYLVRLEESDEKGFGPYFTQSNERQVCKGELGLGADLFAGLYVGLCLDEVIDFFSGFVGEDFKKDDF